MNVRNFILTSFIFSIIFASCGLWSGGDRDLFPKENRTNLMEIDQRFSQMSIERGMKTAFLHYIARDGVLIRPDEKPLVGADAIEFLSEVDDDGYKVSWQPQNFDISADGTMGYTYGIYKVEVDGDVFTGGYTNIWKKQNGEWRFVVSSTNEGTEE